MPTPGFLFDSAARRFRDASGKFVPSRAVRDAVDSLAAGVGGEMRAEAARLQSGEINGSEFTLRMRGLIKAAHVATGTIALGGKRGLDARGKSAIANAIKTQYAYLYGLSREIEAGLPLDARFLARSAMYGQAARSAYENIGRERDIEAGYTQERRRIGGPRPCAGCIAEAAKGWRPAGELIKIGGCECLTRCACTFVRRKSKGTAAMSHAPTPEGVWSPLVAFAKGGSAKPRTRPADATGGLQGATGATPAGTSAGKPGKGKSKGSSKLHGAGNCGTGKGGFRPGNTCGKSGRAKLAEDIRKARASAGDHGGHAALRDKVKALKMHRRGHEHAVADDHAGQLRAGLRTGKTARNSKIKAETVAHAHAEVKAAHAAQRARNAAEARRKPVHVIQGEEHFIVNARRQHIEGLRELKAKYEATLAKGNADKLKAHREEAWDKANDPKVTPATRHKWGKEYEKRNKEYEAHRDAHGFADYQMNRADFNGTVAKAEADFRDAVRNYGDGLKRVNYAAIHAEHPDHIAPGNIADRLAKYRVGDAKIRAIQSIDRHYEAKDSELAIERTKLSKENALHAEAYVSAIKANRPEFVEASRAEMARVTAELNRVKADQKTLTAQRRDDIDSVLKVDRPMKFENPDVDPGFKAYDATLGPPTAGTIESASQAREWLGKHVSRGDLGSMSVPLGEAAGARAHYGDTYIQAGTNASVRTMVHEHGHAIDDRVTVRGRSVDESAREFLSHRVGDEEPVSMREKFGDAYDHHEMGRKDKFDKAFDDESSAYYVGKDYGGKSSEITSMGLQAMHADAARFARRDPEYFKFISGVMDGSLR